VAETRTYKFRSRPEAVAAARKALDGLDSLLDAGAFYDASLCVSELVTNAVLHADIAADSELQLDVDVQDEGKLVVSVTDAGAGFDPATPTAGDESGWGLFIVDRLSHRWGVDRRGGTRVWFEMVLPTQAVGEQASGARRNRGEPEPDEAEGNLRNHAVSRVKLGPLTTG
jgi:anti-sigma regulatory factor (Ser/Thr protein kinase)